MKIIITWLLFIGVIAVNALANILPINGYNTGQISAFYPNAFVPAGFTFSIWGVIYLLLLSYTIGFTFYSFKPQQHPKAFKFIERVNTYFLLTCVFNMSWIVAWHYLQIELSVLIMLLFLSTLIQLFLKTKSMANDLTLIQRFILQTPFIVYLGWISVATIANITALLVAYKWTALSIAPVYWSAAMILIATPDTTWSTPNETVATACKRAPTAPKIIAANNPIQGPCWEPINPPAHAPKIIIPSRPILTTPARSENNPPSPAKIIGTESNNAADTVPTLVNSVAPVINRIIDISNKR
jgi:hypothetical protein